MHDYLHSLRCLSYRYLFNFYDSMRHCSLLILKIYNIKNIRYRNTSVDEIDRIENTPNYDTLHVAAPMSTVELDKVGGMGYKEVEKNFVDEKGQFAAIAPGNG